MNGNVVYEAHPAMFRAHPFWFIGCVVLIPAFGIGILLLLYWYIHTRQTALTVTENELLYERGILSKDRTSVSLKHIRAVHITQGFLNRILGVGTIQVSTRRRSTRIYRGQHAGSGRDKGRDLASAGRRGQGLEAACRARKINVTARRRRGSCLPQRSRSCS
jgi:uncharacterized membrane protein YdbT with pleckstrin-like domain